MNEFDELGAKVKRSQDVIENLSGTAERDGVRVEVDCHGRVVGVEFTPEALKASPTSLAETVAAVCKRAVADVEPRVSEATREVSDDPMMTRLEQWVRGQEGPPTKKQATVDDRSYIERRGGTIYQSWNR